MPTIVFILGYDIKYTDLKKNPPEIDMINKTGARQQEREHKEMKKGVVRVMKRAGIIMTGTK